MSLLQRMLRPVADVRREEVVTALLMFAYSFLMMWGYNLIRPITRSAFIKNLGADNLPWMPLVASVVIATLMAGYTWLVSVLPRRWGLPIIQAGMAAALVLFWFLFKTEATWVAIAFYLWGLMLGILLTSQFWTLANVTYDARQAKRLFGFIGAGAPLGGTAGGLMAAFGASRLGTFNLVLYSGAILLLGVGVVLAILAREKPAETVGAGAAAEERGVGFGEALRLLRESKHLQVIAIVISFAAIGANIIEQQLNMAAQAAKGRADVDALTAFLGLVTTWTSTLAFIIQVWLTSRIHRFLGIGFALLVLPVGFATTAVIMLLNGALWAPSLARVLDQSLRYTVDKTSREILFLPLPADLKYRAKPFVDVTVDRVAKGLSGLLMLLLVKPWGLNLDWQQVSYASLTIVGLWIAMAIRVKRQYVAAFRNSLQQRVVEPQEVRLAAADLSTVETLVQELAHPDASRVVYAIDVLESLDKRNLVTPLLLYHASPIVRTRALAALGAARPDIAEQWAPQIRRMLGDADSGVRAAAITALSVISHEDATSLARPMLSDPDPRIRVTAAAALAGSTSKDDVDAAEATLVDIISDTSSGARDARRDVAAAIRQTSDPRFKRLLIPLLYDPAPEVADEAMESVRAVGLGDFVFVPTLITLLRHRRLKGQARSVLVGYGEPVIGPLGHFMQEPDEDVWVRRHIPATLALIRSQKSVETLAGALEDPDGFLRYKAVEALERLRRDSDGLVFPHDKVERLALSQARQYFNYLSLRQNIFGKKALPADSLLALALSQKLERTEDRIFRLLGLVYPWKDIAAARWTLKHGDARNRASALEYLDNLLTGQLRKQIMPVIEEMPVEEKVRRGNVLLKTRPRDVEETLLQLINDDDQVVAAAAIEVVRQQKMWTLGDDIEHVLAHRDARDWYVFEAASWALAERRMPADRRRELWHEPLPAAELASRLRHLPLFASLTVDELFRLTGAGRQVRHEAGTVLLQAGSVPESIHLLLEGEIAASNADGGPRRIQAPAALGFTESLAGTPMRETLRTVDTAVTLMLSAEELRTLLSENIDLVVGLFATLAGRGGDSESPVHHTGAAPELGVLSSGGLEPVEKVLALQRVPVFSRVSAEEMRHLASIAQTITMNAGSPLFAESAGPAVWLLLSGEVSLESSVGAPALTARGGDVIGSIGTMAGRSLDRSADVTRSGLALRIDRDDLFAVSGERPELLRQLFAGLFRNEAFVRGTSALRGL